MIINKEQFEFIDSFFKNDNTMDIYTPIGSKVIFSFPNNGTEYEQNIAKKYLILNKEYTIEKIEIGSWHTDVFLKEIKNISFNSVLFSNKEV